MSWSLAILEIREEVSHKQYFSWDPEEIKGFRPRIIKEKIKNERIKQNSDNKEELKHVHYHFFCEYTNKNQSEILL